MARYNSVNTTSSVAGGSTISTPASGLLTTLTGSGTVTIANPVYYTGQTQTFYNSTGSTITLSTPSGFFTGPGTGSSSSVSIPAGSVITVVSDGTNYVAQSWLGGAITVGGTLTATGTVAINPTGLNVSIQPTGAGVLSLSSGATGTLDNVSVGATTRSTGAFTTLTSNGTTTFTAGNAATFGTGSTGTLQVTGGTSISGILNVGAGTYSTSSTANAAIAASNSGTSGYAATFSGLAQAYTGTYGAQSAYEPAGTLVTITSLPNSVASAALITFNAYNATNGASGIHLGAVAGPTGNGPASFIVGRRTGTSTWSESIRIDTNGNLGVGASSPTTILTIKKPIDSAAYGSGTRMIDFQSYYPGYDVDTVKASIYAGVSGIGTLNTQGGYLAFYTNNNGTNAERMRIEKDGTIGIGTTNTNTATGNYTFNVALRARFNGMMLGNNDGTSASDNRILLDWSSGSSAQILAQQNVPLQLGSNNAVQLYMAPTYVQVATSTYFNVGQEIQSYSSNGNSGASGVYEVFRVSSSQLCTSGFFSVGTVSGSYVHTSTWAWSSSHNGSGQGTITMLSSNTYANMTMYLDVDTGGNCIVSADWGRAQNYNYSVMKTQGTTLSVANNGTSQASPPSGYTRYSRTTISSGFAANNGKFDGSLSKGSGSFRIPHPLPKLTEEYELVHSFIEGPNADLIYRGEVELTDGQATVDIDQHSRMTDGTFEVLCRKVQCFTTNETDWTAVRGRVTGNILTIEAQDATSTATVSWMVIGERKDPHMYETDWTDANGEVIVEPLKNPVNTDFPPTPADVNKVESTNGTI